MFVTGGWDVGFFEAVGAFKGEVGDVDGQVVGHEPGFGWVLGFAVASVRFFVWWQFFFEAFDRPVEEVLAVDSGVVDYGIVF